MNYHFRQLMIGVAVATSLASPVKVLAQGGQSLISATVSDPSGAIVKSAAVVVSSRENLFRREVLSDDVGRIEVRVPPGTYTIRASFPGFQDASISDVSTARAWTVTCNLSCHWFRYWKPPLYRPKDAMTISAECPFPLLFLIPTYLSHSRFGAWMI